LTPIPKGLITTDYNKYRGIAVSSIFSKLHEHVLFSRADDISEHLNMRSPTQCGFRSGHGTLDATFTLQHLITRARAKGHRLYVVFIDFTKAFDMVSRPELIARCARLGFTGRFLDAITQLYDQVHYRTAIQARLGPAISSTAGTKQGSHLSPLLFGWFIEQLHDLLIHRIPAEDATTLGDGPDAIRVPDIFYADDGNLISSDTTCLQTMLTLLSLFSAASGMEVNVTKTVWMEFLPARAHPDTTLTLTYRDQPITKVEECIYMG